MGKLCFLVASITLSLSFQCLFAQSEEQVDLSIEEMFVLADKNNSKIEYYKTSAEEAKASVDVAKNAYLPSIEASLSVSYNGDGTIMNRDFSHSFSAPIPSFGNNFSLEASQIIFAGGAIKSSVEVAELQSQISMLQTENSRQDIRFLIVGNFLELCKIENQLQVFESNIIQTKRLLENMRLKFSEGTVLENDITRYELQLQNLNYSIIQLNNSRQILNNHLTVTLGLPLSLTIIPKNQNSEELEDVTRKDWQLISLNRSPSIKMAERGIELNKQRENIIRAERYPQIALFATNQLIGPVTIDIPSINKNFNYWAVGVGIKYNLDNLFKTDKKIRTHQFATQKAVNEKSMVEENLLLSTEAAHIRFMEAYSLLETKEKSLELANQNYEVISYRYENDLALITDLLDATSQKLDAELQTVNSKINILYNYYKLKYISGTL